MSWVKVPSELGEGRPVVVNPGNIAVFEVSGNLYAINNKCAHGRGQLAEGDIEELPSCMYGSRSDGSKVPGLVVKCPKHRGKFPGGLCFSLDEGRAFVSEHSDHFTPSFHVPTYETRRDDHGNVWVFTDPQPGTKITRKQKFGILVEKIKNNVKAKFGSPGRKQSQSAAAGSAAGSAQGAGPAAWKEWLVESKHDNFTRDSFVMTLRAPASWTRDSAHDTVIADSAAPVMWHVSFRDRDDPSLTRDYTPISSAEEYHSGILRFWIKVYPTGALTPKLAKLNVDDHVLVSPPEITATLDMGADKSHFGLIAGGTGITPMLQAAHIINRTSLPWKGSLIWSVHDRQDINAEMRKWITDAAEHRAGRINALITFTRLKARDDDVDDQKGTLPVVFETTGRINSGMINRTLPPAKYHNHAIFVSGPDPMMESVLELLSDLGFDPESCFELEA